MPKKGFLRADIHRKMGLTYERYLMSASPFRATPGPFVQVPVPVKSPSMNEAKNNLKDVPFKSEGPQLRKASFPKKINLPEKASLPNKKVNRAVSPSRSLNWFQVMVKGRSSRRLREEQLAAELRDLRASYAGLLQSTEGIREKLESEKREPAANKVLAPFPSAVARIDNLASRQEEASKILGSIREQIDTKDQALLTSVETIQGGVGEIQADVKGVSRGIADLAKKQVGAVASLGDLGKKIDMRFEKAAEVAQKSADRIEQSSDDVLQVLRQMERNSQRGVWIFASLLAVLFVTLLCFSAKISPSSSQSTPEVSAEKELPSMSPMTADEEAVMLSEIDF